jgi:hypothetical protein
MYNKETKVTDLVGEHLQNIQKTKKQKQKLEGEWEGRSGEKKEKGRGGRIIFVFGGEFDKRLSSKTLRIFFFFWVL